MSTPTPPFSTGLRTTQADLTQTSLLEMALKAVRSGIIITDCTQPDNPIIYANPGFEQLTGYSPQEILGHNCHFLQGSDCDQAAILELRAAIKEGRATTVVLRNYRKDGTRFYNELYLSPVYDALGHLTNFIGIQTDVTARIEAEEAQRKSEELYRTLINGFPNGAVLLFDSELRYFLAEGSGFSPILKPEDLLGKTLDEILPPETSVSLKPFYQAALEGTSNTIEIKFRDNYYLVHFAPLKNTSTIGKVGTIIVQNITELRVAQEEREAVQNQLTSTLENMTEAFFTLGQEGCFTYINTEATRLLGQPSQQLLGRNIWEAFPETINSTFYTKYQQILIEQIPVHFEEYYAPAASWLELKVYPASNGGISVYLRDITARRKAEEELIRRELRFRTLIEHSTEMITMTGAKGEVLYQSPAVATVMGYTEEELAGRNSFELVHTDDVAMLLAQHKELLVKPGTSHQNEFRFRHKDGSWHYVETYAQNLLHLAGIEAIVINGRDVTVRKQTDLALRHSQEMLNFALSAAQIGIWEYDIASGKVEGSVHLEPLLGLRPGSFSGTYEALVELALPEDRPKLKQVVQEALENGSDYHIEYRIQRHDGQIQWLEGRGQAYYDALGQPLRLSGTVQDITLRKHTEAALLESEARFVAFMEHTPAAAFIMDATARLVYVNKAYQELFELEDVGELVGRNCSDLFPPEISEQHHQHDQWVLENQQVLEEIETWKRRDGSISYWLGYKFPMQDLNGQALVGGVGIDITQSKQAEEALRLSEARLSGIINSATDAIITLDSQQRIVVFNTAAENMFDCKAAEATGTSLERFLPERYRQTHSTYITKFGQTGTTSRAMGKLPAILTALRQNGEEFPIEATISQVDTADQNFYTVIIQDITERTKAEESLAKSEAQLRQAQKMEAVGQLAGGVAHDFNNLLTAITGYSELILFSLNEQDPLYEDVNQIKRAAERAASLTRQLLAFSRQQVLQLSILNLNEVVSEMNRMLHRLIGEKIELVTRLDVKLSQVKADQGQLEQVLVNLAVNARDAMPKGGKLIFETGNVEVDEAYTLDHPYINPGRYVSLSVSDTGLGMSDTVRLRLFEPFFTTKERGRGTGLGLSTVYGIIKQSGGYIEVYSKEGHGSTFKIYLPIASASSEAAQAVNQTLKVKTEGTRPTIEQDQRETILLVEDEDGVRHLATRILEQYGYKVLQAGHGGEALLLAEQHQGQVELLITDMIMPHIGGPELAQRLTSLQPRLRVLYMSGYTDQSVLEYSMLSEEDILQNFLHKPFSPQSLANKVREILDRK